MPATRIATTAIRDMQALGTGGQRAIDAADTLLALLARELSPAHAALFAEPQFDAARGVIDWYAEGTGPAEPLSTLPPDRAVDAQARLDALIDDIRDLIDRLRQARGESDRFLAEMLERALHIPNTDAVRVRNGVPILVDWGHERIAANAAPIQMRGRARASMVPMAILPPPVLPAPSGPRLLPRIIALVVALLLLGGAIWLYLSPPVLVAAGGSCTFAQSDLDAIRAWRETDARNAALRAQLAALVDEAGRRRLRCPPGQQAVMPPLPQSQPSSQAAQRAELHGGQTGRLQIILTWDDENDLDLHVLCPDNTHVFFEQRTGCGGELDVDANSDPQHSVDQPVESMYWLNPPPGTYKVFVDPYGMRVSPSSPFRLTIRQEGQPDQVIQGVAQEGHHVSEVTTVQVAPSSAGSAAQ